MRFHERLAEIAEEKGLTQADVSRLTGLTTSQVNHLFNGRAEAPRLVTVLMIANALNISMDELADGLEFEQKDGSIFTYSVVNLGDE